MKHENSNLILSVWKPVSVRAIPRLRTDIPRTRVKAEQRSDRACSVGTPHRILRCWGHEAKPKPGASQPLACGEGQLSTLDLSCPTVLHFCTNSEAALIIP